MNSEEIKEDEDIPDIPQQKTFFTPGRVISYHKKDHRVFVKTENFNITITFLSNQLFRITLAKQNKPNLSTTEAVIGHQLSMTDFSIIEKNNHLLLRTDELNLKIKLDPYFMTIYNQEGELLTSDYNQALASTGKEVWTWKKARKGERIYGLGEKTGHLDKKGRNYTMWNTDVFEAHVESTDPMYVSIPFYIGFKQGRTYGIYLDNSYQTHFEMKGEENNFYSIWAEGGKLDYYFIYGPDIKGVVKKYTDLTGKMCLPPRWSLGYHQSRYSYKTEKEVREITNKFREKEIPCDTIHLDIHYMHDYRVFTWDENRFPQPEKMISDLHNKGFKIVNIIDPGVKRDPEYKVYQQGISNDYFCRYMRGELFRGDVWPGESVFPDFTRKEVRNWWSDLHKKYIDQGVNGFWNDMNEPAVFNETYTMDEEVLHKNDGNPGLHKRFHNLYALFEAKATYKALQNYRKERPFVLSRAGFSGIQRYAAIWTGDNRSYWDHLKMAVPMLVNLGLSGVGFVGTDIGGFSEDCNGELLTRWIQLGTFMPFFRNHTCINTTNQEPWAFGQKYEDIIKKYIRLRYKFLTHLYSLFYICHKTGLPIIRPLVMEYPEDENTHNLSYQFMVGEQIMIAPVYEPDKNKKMVYIPEGNWFDFHTDKLIKGAKHHISEAPLSKLPIFIKEGSIIPIIPSQNFVGEKEFECLNLHIYCGTQELKNTYNLFEDDGISNNYKNKDRYKLTTFKYQCKNNIIYLNSFSKVNNYNPDYIYYQLILHNIDKVPATITNDENEIYNWEYNHQSNLLQIKISARNEFQLKIHN